MTTFVHTADWQLGAANQPDCYSLAALPRLIEKAESLGAQYVIVAGDIFDKPRPDQHTKDYLLNLLLKHRNLTFVLCVGNHDYVSKAREYNSLVTYWLLSFDIPTIKVCNPGTVLELEDLNCVHLNDLQSWPKATDGSTISYNTSKPLVGVWHGMIPGFSPLTNAYPRSTKISIADFMKRYGIDYLALGDIHKRKCILPDRCYYSGSLFQKTYTDECGYVVVNSNGTKTVAQHNILDIPQRVVFSVVVDQNDTPSGILDEVCSAIRALANPGDLIKIKFSVTMAEWMSMPRNEIVDALSGDFLEVKLHNDAISEDRTRDGYEDIVKKTGMVEEVHAIIDAEPLTLDKNRLMSVCQRYLK